METEIKQTNSIAFWVWGAVVVGIIFFIIKFVGLGRIKFFGIVVFFLVILFVVVIGLAIFFSKLFSRKNRVEGYHPRSWVNMKAVR